VFFIWYGLAIQSWPMLVTEFIILPLNIIRLYQLTTLLRRVEVAAATNQMTAEWLKPFGREKAYRPGDVVFRSGDVAEFMLMLQSGSFELVEAGKTLGVGEVVGEMGFLSPGNRRTMTLVCREFGRVSEVSYSDMKQLYFSNPKFAFYLLKLVSERMFENADRVTRDRLREVS
jgi:CRP/FNR family transcriptional regulator, cyclic AMP receptor protein